MHNYRFTSHRLGFRNWQHADLAPMAAMNADPAVMEFFPGTQTEEQTAEFIQRMQDQYAATGYCYYAVDTLIDNNFIGFIGLSDKTFDADFTPCVDIGWRLGTHAWHKGYATEGAHRCLEYGFNELGLAEIVAMAPQVNLRSIHIMHKLGMSKRCDFAHPLLPSDARLRQCVLYGVSRDVHRYP
ncbi:MAG: GNAT family N-acetyltransferase [Bacteroidota bacterium]